MRILRPLLYLTLALITIGLSTFVGSFLARLTIPREQWTPIGPPSVEAIDLKVFQHDTSIYYQPFVVLVRTADGRLLSSGLQRDRVKAWNWTDISHSQAWKDFPAVTIGELPNVGYVLYTALEEGTFWVDTLGQWQPLETANPPSPFQAATLNRADQADYANYPRGQWPEGEVVKVQGAITGHWEAPTVYIFALVKDKGIWLLEIAGGVGPAIYTFYVSVVGSILGFIAGVILVIAGFLWRRRQQRGVQSGQSG